MWVRQSIHLRNRESDPRKDKSTRQRYTACSYADLRSFGACKRNGACILFVTTPARQRILSSVFGSTVLSGCFVHKREGRDWAIWKNVLSDLNFAFLHKNIFMEKDVFVKILAGLGLFNCKTSNWQPKTQKLKKVLLPELTSHLLSGTFCLNWIYCSLFFSFSSGF